jgi:hypothetical protein
VEHQENKWLEDRISRLEKRIDQLERRNDGRFSHIDSRITDVYSTIFWSMLALLWVFEIVAIATAVAKH